MASPQFTRAKSALALLLALTACAGTLRHEIYRADRHPVVVGANMAVPPRPMTVRTGDRLALSGYIWPGAADDEDVLVFFHGRGSNPAVAARYAQALTGRGDHVIVASYRGFAGNPGRPSEEGLIADARAFIAAARAMVGPQGHVLVVGHSLGGAVALHAAALEQVDGVAALSSFDTLARSAPGGVGALLPDTWDNVDAIRRVHAPVLLAQGTSDPRVSVDQAETLFAAAPSPAGLIMMPGAGHSPDMATLGPVISGMMAAIHAGRPTGAIADLPAGWTIRVK
jgi:alpha-beta hydrolase superfamily lysophospholipase